MSLEETSASDRIRHTIAEFCHLTDGGDFDDWVRLFIEDGCFRLFDEEFRGHPALRAFIEQDQPPGRRGLHLTTDSAITMSADHARVRSNFIFVAGGDTANVVVAGGRYLDVLVPVGDRWLFKERQALLVLPVATQRWGSDIG